MHRSPIPRALLAASAASGPAIQLAYEDNPEQITVEQTSAFFRAVIPITGASRRAAILRHPGRYPLVFASIGPSVASLVTGLIEHRPLVRVVLIFLVVQIPMALLFVAVGFVWSYYLRTTTIELDADELAIVNAATGKRKSWPCKGVRHLAVRPCGRSDWGRLVVTLKFEDKVEAGFARVKELEPIAKEIQQRLEIK